MAARRGECVEASQAWILLEISFCFISNYFSLPTTSRDGCLARAAHPSSHPAIHPSIPPSHGTWKAVLAIPPESTRYTTEPCRCHSVPAVISRAKRVYRLNPSTCTYGGGTHTRSPHTHNTPHTRDERDSRQTRCPSRVHCRKSLSLRLLDPCKGGGASKGQVVAVTIGRASHRRPWQYCSTAVLRTAYTVQHRERRAWGRGRGMGHAQEEHGARDAGG